jgi:hypothetical protein
MARVTARALVLGVVALVVTSCAASGEPGVTPVADLSGGAVPDGQVAVSGYYLATPDGQRLCETLRGAYPPTCGGESIALSVDREQVQASAEADFESATEWLERPVTVTGRLRDGVLTVTSFEAEPAP